MEPTASEFFVTAVFFQLRYSIVEFLKMSLSIGIVPYALGG
jgi:hypothetical protein